MPQQNNRKLEQLVLKTNWTFLVNYFRTKRNIQLTSKELHQIIGAVKQHRQPSILVFGLGNDAPLWDEAGMSWFVEHDRWWIQKFLVIRSFYFPYYNSYCQSRSHTIFWPDDKLFYISFIPRNRFDIVIVDGPPAHNLDTQPGRWESFYTALYATVPGGTVFLHDAARPHEAYLLAKASVEIGRINSIDVEGNLATIKIKQEN